MKEQALWNQSFTGTRTRDLVDQIDRQTDVFRSAYEEYEKARQAMIDAGFLRSIST